LSLVSGRRLRAAAAGTMSGIGSNVVFLGLTSLFTDISSEMVVSVLPIYLVTFLHLTPAQFGFIDGLYQGVAAAVQLASGVVTDRWRRYKQIAGLGYVLSAVCRVGLLTTTAWTGIAAVLTADRLGKGVRTAPRDALISLSTDGDRLGTAFGIHRALDAMGAMLGPVIAFLLLAWAPNGYDVVFVASLATAGIGVACLALFVDDREPRGHAVSSPTWTAADTIRLLNVRPFRHLAFSATVLGLATTSDAFVYLVLQRRTNLTAGAFPLLYVLTALGFLLLAIPAGRLADRIGRFPVFLGGYLVLLIANVLLMTTGAGWLLIGAVLLLLGAHYAATEGVLMALGSAILPEHARASGLAVLSTATAFARFGASVFFGLAWSLWGVQAALVCFLVGLMAAMTLAAVTWPRTHNEAG
jgi:MFS family permease